MATPTGQQAPATHLDARFHDFEALAEAIEGWDLEWQQLDRGRLEANLQQIQTTSALLTRVAFSRQFYQRGATPPGFLTFGFLRNGTGEINWCGQGGGSNDLLAFRSGGEYESMSPPGFGANTVSVSENLLDRVARSLDLPEVRRSLSGSNQLLTCTPETLSELRERLRMVFSTAAANPTVLSKAGYRRQLEAEIPILLLKALNSNDETAGNLSTSGRDGIARRALAAIAERPDEPLTVQELCTAIGVSQRTLQYAFREQLDVTPKQYLQSVRLNGVRRHLRRSDPTIKIADVANHWGFWHLGQFAADYRRHFGELPSETLSRA